MFGRNGVIGYFDFQILTAFLVCILILLFMNSTVELDFFKFSAAFSLIVSSGAASSLATFSFWISANVGAVSVSAAAVESGISTVWLGSSDSLEDLVVFLFFLWDFETGGGGGAPGIMRWAGAASTIFIFLERYIGGTFGDEGVSVLKKTVTLGVTLFPVARFDDLLSQRHDE